MNIQKVTFGGAYKLHCKNKTQAENIKSSASEHHLNYYQSKKGKKDNLLYVVTPDVARDIRALAACVVEADLPMYPAKGYSKEKRELENKIEKQILKNAIDITL